MVPARGERGKVKVYKVDGIENPADLMTKVFSLGEISMRLLGMNVSLKVFGSPTDS